jgi:hypothetical protein
MKYTDVKGKLKKASSNVCTAIIVVSLDPLSPNLSTSSALKTPENTEVDPDDPEQADEGDNHIEKPKSSKKMLPVT